jgi:FKBP-type peptidyl-prolyl cis-trans isomerase (trigger factor)
VVLLKGLPPSSLKELCEVGENAARQFVLSKLDRKLIRSLDIQVTSEKGGKTTFKVEVFVDVEPAVEIDVEELADTAADAALSAIDERMRGKKLG